MCTDDEKDHNSIIQGCENMNLNRHVKDNHNIFTNDALATSDLRFNLSTECDNPNDTIISVTKV